MRKKFSALFMDILKDQLILKGILTEEEWDEVSQDINVDYAKDNYFTELTESEILKERLMALREIEEYVGTYFSRNWIRRHVLRQSDEDIEMIDKEINDEPANTEVEYEESTDPSRVAMEVLKGESQKRLYESLTNFLEDDNDDEEIIENIKVLSDFSK
jgi:hypothetical protein